MHRPWLTLRRPILALAVGTSLAACLAPAVAAQSEFPFGREFMLDAAPIKGSKRIPSIDIDEKGIADITMWCNSVKGQLVVAGDTITIITGPKSDQSCSPERMQGDDDMLAALAAVTNWKLEGDTLVLIGTRTLRFRAQSN
ncbi:MAG TPA: META domain-containing protein [Xanthobacteraceae bacterium]|nr:META domain-containing protein [Xanthobacteraceae bacterium]